MATGTIPCSSCHKKFGGVESFDRHFKRKLDRCKTVVEMRKSGMHIDMDGVWHRTDPHKQTGVLPGMARSGPRSSWSEQITQTPTPPPNSSESETPPEATGPA
jgi:phage FluMu protein Com